MVSPCSPLWSCSYLVTFGTHVVERYSFVAIFDAQNLSQGPVTLLKTPHMVPYGLHGTWVPEEALGQL